MSVSMVKCARCGEKISWPRVRQMLEHGESVVNMQCRKCQGKDPKDDGQDDLGT